jgi:predicted DNA-binding transcriptional regulator AlpA
MEAPVKIISDAVTKGMSGGLSRRQRMRMADEGRFPKPVRLTAGSVDRPGRLGWVESEVLKWNEDRVAERDAGTKPVNGAATGAVVHQEPAQKRPAHRTEIEKKLRLRVDELGLPPRVLGALANDGIACLGQLVQLTETDLMGMPNVGRISIAQIKTTLAKHRLRLGMEIASVPEVGEKDFKEESRAARRRARR